VIDREVVADLDHAVETVRSSPEPTVLDMFKHVWADEESK